MLRNIIAAALTIPLIACSSLQANRTANDDGPVIARAVFSDTVCPSDPERGRAESALGAAAVSWLIGKAVESGVNFISEAISEAAREDSKTFTITGQNPDYLFKVQGDKTHMRGCLFVIVAPRVKDGKWCHPQKQGHWYNTATCRAPAPELENKWAEWSLGTPTFFAEIGVTAPKGGPVNVVIPRAYKVYYPAPISTMDVDKVKGLTVSVTASKPSKSSKASGDIVLELFLGGDGVTPKTISSDATKLQTSGLWVNVPTAEGLIGSSYAGPVNLSVTVAETPHPTKWLQAIAKHSEENKQNAINKIVAKVDPAARDKAEEAKIVDGLALEGAAATSCAAFSEQMVELAALKKDVTDDKGATYEEKLQYGYALDAACSATKLIKRTTLANWQASGKPSSSRLCGRAQDADVEINSLCQH